MYTTTTLQVSGTRNFSTPSSTQRERPVSYKHIDQNGEEFKLPDFTMKQIYNAIPLHCLQPSTTRSMGYAFRDLLYLCILMYATEILSPEIPSKVLRTLLYTFSTTISGFVMAGMWNLGHECGHGAFSKYKRINTVMGFLMHSFLLVPYHSFRITHARHHKATGDLERETVFVPSSRQYWVEDKYGAGTDPQSVTLAHLYKDVPIKGARAFPQYSHYWFGRDSAIFTESQLHLVIVSDLGCAAMLAFLHLGVKSYGWWFMIIYYGVPWLWLNSVVAFLQHTDGTLPHFTHYQWTFTRGAAATIDRDFGFIDTHFFHGMVSAHVIHHLVSTIPFYHAREATEAVKTVMGKHYHSDTRTPFLKAFWKNNRDCQFVEESTGMDGSGIFMYRNLHGRGAPPRDLQAGEALTSWPGHMGLTEKLRSASSMKPEEFRHEPLEF